jgi:putative flippase GtrA
LVVSALSLGANQLFLVVLVAAGAGHLAAQAVAIVLATPFSFAANKLWAFAAEPSAGELQPIAVRADQRDS